MFSIKVVDSNTGEVLKEDRIHTDAAGNIHHTTITANEFDLEAAIEKAYWAFDAERKASGAERNAFKRQLRELVVAVHAQAGRGG